MQSILTGLTSADVNPEPFPHLLIQNVLSEEVALRLLREWPSIEKIAKGRPLGSNERMDYVIKDVRNDASVTSFCSEFIEAQASEEFLHDALRIFKPWIDKLYPQLSTRFGSSYENIRRGTRHIQTYDDFDTLVDAHFSINTPVVDTASSVRGAHVDDPRKLFSGLLYLRPPEDTDSQGGDLILYRYRSAQRVFVRQQVKEKYVEPVMTVPYQRGTLIFFLNTIDSLHGVSPRFPTPHTRYFINFVVELEKQLFDIQSLQERGLPSYWRRFRNKVGKMLVTPRK